jgi:hypothetical protein
MTMSNPIATRGVAVNTRARTIWWLSSATVLILAAGAIGNYWSRYLIPQFGDIPVANRVLLAGALPWVFQWAGVSCAIFGLCGSRITRDAGLIAILGSLIPAVIWWSGIFFRFRGADSLEVILDVAIFHIESQFGSSTLFDEFLFNVVGPILGPFQFRGPITLHGWQFVLTLLSTTVLAGYLLFVSCWRPIGNHPKTTRDVVWLAAVTLPYVLPPFAALALRVTQLMAS